MAPDDRYVQDDQLVVSDRNHVRLDEGRARWDDGLDSRLEPLASQELVSLVNNPVMPHASRVMGDFANLQDVIDGFGLLARPSAGFVGVGESMPVCRATLGWQETTTQLYPTKVEAGEDPFREP